jgi:hypothetical protein
MPIEGYDAFDDPYVYKGTKVLKNRLGIRDPASPRPSARFGVRTRREHD